MSEDQKPHTGRVTPLPMRQRQEGDSLEGQYVQGALQYTQKLQHLALEIDKVKTEIALIIEHTKAEEATLKRLEETQHLERTLLEKAHEAFLQKTDSLIELKRDYRVHLEHSEYEKILNRKEEALSHLQDDLEALEQTLLQAELERLNQLEVLTPKRSRIEALQLSLLSLEQEKRYLEITALQQIHQASRQPLPELGHSTDMQETEIIS